MDRRAPERSLVRLFGNGDTAVSTLGHARRRPVAAAVVLSAIVALPVLILLVTNTLLGSRAGIPVGQRVPAALLVTTAGEWIDTAAWVGSPRILVLFHARCPACQRQIRSLEAIVRERPLVPAAAIVLVSLDPEAEAREFARSFGGPFTVAIDPSGKFVRPLRRVAVPTLYLLDAERRVARARSGRADRSYDEALVEALVRREVDR